MFPRKSGRRALIMLDELHSLYSQQRQTLSTVRGEISEVP